MKNYNNLSKILHKQFLGKNLITELFIDKLRNQSKYIDLKKHQYIFISGLARSGTTALLEALDGSKEFSSIRYKYMPFILSPKLAKFFSRFQNKINTQERFHSDGIKINSESPECLDEPFWINSTYLKLKCNNYLYPHELNDNLIKSYTYLLEQYSNIECGKRIIIKNNNNHLRIFKLSRFLRNSKFLILFRSPKAHAKSLLNQHKRFIKLQKKDIFLKEYMNYLGHWEFGENKKPFIYAEDQYLELTSLDAKTIDYWIKQWIFTYNWILKELSSNEYPNIRLICYEDLCSNKRYENKLYDFLNLNNKKYYYKFEVGKSNQCQIKFPNSEYINHAENIYDQMKKKSFI